MTIRSFFLVILALFCINTPAGAEVLTRSEVRQTFSVALEAADDAWYEAYEAENTAYSDARRAVLSHAYDLDRAALQLFRTANRDIYLEYLDAKEWGDYERIHLLASQHTELQEYRDTARAAWDESTQIVDGLREEHQAREVANRDVREAAKQAARDIRDEQLALVE